MTKKFKKGVLAKYLVLAENVKYVYHGTHEDLKKLETRPIKNYHSVGSWFSEDINHAKMYGPKIFKFELPKDLKLYSFTGDFSLLWFDKDLAKKYFTKGGKDLVAKVEKKFVGKEDSVLYKALEDYLKILTAEIDSSDPDYMNKLLKKREAQKIVKYTRGFDNFMRENLYTNIEYLTAWKKKFEQQGYDGIFFNGVRIDTPNPVKAWLIFNPSVMGPVNDL